MDKKMTILSLEERTEFKQVEELISSRKLSADPLIPEIHKLINSFYKLLDKANDLTNENRRIKSQLLELGRSLELTTRVDVMTGLANRSGILGRIEQEFSRARRHKHKYSIILADIDELRCINENYGFNAGDEVLVEIANIIRGCIRGEDVCSRWSGGQFMLLLPETGITGAEFVARKICEITAQTVFRVNKPGIRLTMSLGASEYLPGDNTFQCISRADQALSLSKRSGKNCYSLESSSRDLLLKSAL